MSENIELIGGFRDGAVMNVPTGEPRVSVGQDSPNFRYFALYQRSDPERVTQNGYIAFDFVPAALH